MPARIDVPGYRNQALISAGLLAIGVYAAYLIGSWIGHENLSTLEYSIIYFTVVVISITIVRQWRTGTYLFLVWLLFEDFIRKYMGNSMTVYFAKDFLAALTFFSMLAFVHSGREKLFRPKFLLPLSLFFWWGFIQVFNPYSPHLLYGLLGLKVYYYYIPLMWVGFALVESYEELRKFLVFNMILAGIIGALGVVQAVRGPTFLNPVDLAPEIRDLATLQRYAPISGAKVYAPTSVFVSTGRFAWYQLLSWILCLGTSCYLLLKEQKGRKVVFGATAVVTVAILVCASRGTFLMSLGSAMFLGAGFLWGAPWRLGKVLRVVRSLRRSLIVAALALWAMLLFFPDVVGAHWSFYSETANPVLSTSDVKFRVSDYPIRNLTLAFSFPHWITGYGIGTASLGVQYVSAVLKEPPLPIQVEEGYGTMIVEMGILAPFLWLVWTATLLIAGWRVVRKLKQTALFPIGLSILWFIFLLLYPMTYGGMSPYQNYVYNAYLWLLVGVLFRLPDLLNAPQRPQAGVPSPESTDLVTRAEGS